MKIKIYTFISDDDNGMSVSLFTDKEKLRAAVLDKVAASESDDDVYSDDKKVRSELAKHPYDSDEWNEVWDDFAETESYDNNYYAFDTIELEVEEPPYNKEEADRVNRALCLLRDVEERMKYAAANGRLNTVNVADAIEDLLEAYEEERRRSNNAGAGLCEAAERARSVLERLRGGQT